MKDEVKHSFNFFQNKDCGYFPCHEIENEDNFNCLFCYCPLYFLGEKCGGNFKKVGINEEIKDCSNCLLPHKKENYNYIVLKASENIEQFKKVLP